MTITVEKTLEEVISLVLEEADRALQNPYEFKKPIKNVAIIGAGPSGVSLHNNHHIFFFAKKNVFFFLFFLVTNRKTLEGIWI